MFDILSRTRCMTALWAALASASPAFGQSASQDTEVDTITVTARKRAEALLEVPVSASVVSAETIEQRGVNDVKDILAIAPNVSFPDPGSNNINTDVVIRGISSNTRNVGFESGVGVYVDGVYLGRTLAVNQELVGIRQIEVLRGPQGTVFGKNTISGALNILTMQPMLNRVDAGGMLQYGEFEDASANAYANLPLGESAALRLSAFKHDSEGYVRNLTTGGRLADDDAVGGRMQFLYAPGTRFRLVLAADYRKDDRLSSFPETIGGGSIPGIADAVPGPFTTALTRDPTEERELWGTSVTADYEFGGGHTLTWISAYRDNSDHVQNDNDNDALDLFPVNFLDEEDHFTQEIRLTSPDTGRFSYIVGLYYFDQNASQYRDAFFPPPTDFLSLTGTVSTESWAAFMDTQLEITDAFTLGIGLRYTNERKRLSDFDQQSVGVGVLPLFFPSFPARVGDSRSADDVSPVLTLNYAFSDDMNGYARIARGFKSGGWNVDFAQGAPVTNADAIEFDDETLTSYEIGLKSRLLQTRLRLDWAAFYMDYEDQQIQQAVGVTFPITNAGSSTVYGTELDIGWELTSDLLLSGGVGYVRTRFDDFAGCGGIGVDCTGNRLGNAPEWTASVAAHWEKEIGNWVFSAHADHAFRDAWYGDALNSPPLRTGSTEETNIGIGMGSPNDSWRVTVFVNNVFDAVNGLGRFQDNFIDPGTISEAYARPRTVGVRLNLRLAGQ
jgi:iron complex outermembrane recepter protein